MKSLFKKIIVALITLEAKTILKKYKPKIVGVTGSVGKTSTKDSIYAALADSFHVRKSEKSFNSELGVPLTIIGGRNGWNNPFIWLETLVRGLRQIVLPSKYPAWLVLEIGADRPGDIKALASWIKFDIVVVTRIGDTPVHVEFFKSREHLIEEKSYLSKALKPHGVLILNADDVDVLSLKSNSRGHLVTFGMKDATVVGSNYSPYYKSGTGGQEILCGFSFKVNVKGNCIPVVREGVLGEHHMYPVLAAFSVASVLEINSISIASALGKEVPAPGRMRIIEGIKGSTLIDDSYNSSPVAVEIALRTMKVLSKDGVHTFAVLGDMLELGKFSTEEHRKIGELASVCVDTVIAVGIRSGRVAESARASGMKSDRVLEFENAFDAGRYLDPRVKKGDLILVKGSQGMRMERVVEELMAHPENKEKLLVRQDKEWLRR